MPGHAKRFAALVVAALCSPTAHAQDKAPLREAARARKPTVTERAICLDRDITRRDAQLNGLYSDLRRKLTSKQFQPIRAEQQSWLRDRNRCGGQLGCLKQMYTDRIAALEQVLENLAYPKQSHVAPSCEKANVDPDSNCLAGGSLRPTCKSLGKLKSPASTTPITVTFVNKTKSYRGVMWLDSMGTPVAHANLTIGQGYTAKTFVGHAWMFTDGPGNCMEMFVARPGISQFDIRARSPAFGPGND